MIDFRNSELLNKFLKDEFGNIVKKSGISKDSIDKEWIELFLVLRLLQIQDCEDEKMWQDFREEILHKNRYFPQSPLVEKIKELAPYATIEYGAGFKLYRCREISTEDIFETDFVKDSINFVKRELQDMNLTDDDFKNSSMLSTIITRLIEKPGIEETILDRYCKKLEDHDDFWGFKEADSDAPPCDKTKSMRANPKGISYLYVAEDIDTSLMEMRPQLGTSYSIATIEITKPIKLFDFSGETVKKDETSVIKYSRTVLNQMFSQTNYGDSLEYIPTQYLCEYIKLQGFDGIRYSSSLSKEGKNIVLFNVDDKDKKYKIIKTEIYGINSIKIDSSKMLPLTPDELEEMLNLQRN